MTDDQLSTIHHPRFSDDPCSCAFVRGFITFAQDIKLSHTIFALPWAILAGILAWRRTGGPLVGKLALILICMITARTVAMASNRLLDAELDKRNPRTARRAIPSGRLSPRFVTFALFACAFAFIATTSLFYILYNNLWPLLLSVPVLAFISAYPLLKRFTRLCHYYLGAALALAPICAYLAIAARVDAPAILMAIAVLCWTAGFDIIYACQDYHSDLDTGTISVPAKLGIAKALWISRLTHAAAFAALLLLGLLTPEFSLLYYLGLTAVALLLIIEHALVSPTDLTRAGLAFFTINGIISLLVGTLGVLDVLV